MGRFDLRTRTGLISTLIEGLSASAYDVDAQLFFNRVTTAGGTLSQTEKDAVNTLVLNLKLNGIWTLMKAIYPMVGASPAACSQNLKSSSFTGLFTTGWVYSNNGITSNGGNTYMDTNFNTSTNLVKTSAHLSLYVRTLGGGSGYDLGNSSDSGATTNTTFFITRYSNNVAYFGIADNSYATSISSSDAIGFWIGATNGSSTQIIYKNGTAIKTGTAGTGSLANNNLYLGANNGNGTANLYSTRQFSFASIGDGLDGTQASNLNTLVQAFQTALSR